MAESKKSMAVPVGPGGAVGRFFRVLLMFCTGGFMFPNSMVEGMDLTEMQNRTMGTLYDKK